MCGQSEGETSPEDAAKGSGRLAGDFAGEDELRFGEDRAVQRLRQGHGSTSHGKRTTPSESQSAYPRHNSLTYLR